MLRLTLIVSLLVLCAVPGMAAGIPVAGADVGLAYWNAIGTGETIPALTLTLHPYAKESGPATPTKVSEILPWAKANLGIDVPFEGDDTTLLRPLGIGVSEAITVGTVQSIPIRAGIGWLGGTGTCWFVRTNLISF